MFQPFHPPPRLRARERVVGEGEADSKSADIDVLGLSRHQRPSANIDVLGLSRNQRPSADIDVLGLSCRQSLLADIDALGLSCRRRVPFSDNDVLGFLRSHQRVSSAAMGIGDEKLLDIVFRVVGVSGSMNGFEPFCISSSSLLFVFVKELRTGLSWMVPSLVSSNRQPTKTFPDDVFHSSILRMSKQAAGAMRQFP